MLSELPSESLNRQPADLPSGAPGGEAEWDAAINFARAEAEVTAFDGGVHHGSIIDPDLDAVRADFQADLIPLIVLEADLAAGGVFGCVEVVDVGDADQPTAPAADHEGEAALCGADGEGAGRKKILTFSTAGLKVETVVDPRQAERFPIARESGPGHRLAGREGEQVFCHRDGAFVGYFGSGPQVKMVRIQKRDLRGWRGGGWAATAESEEQHSEAEIQAMAYCRLSDSWHGDTVSGERDESNGKVPAAVRWWRLMVLAVGLAVVLWAGLVASVGQNHFLIAPLCYLPRVFLSVLLLALAVPGWWWGRGRMGLLIAGALIHQVVVLNWMQATPRVAPEPAPGLRTAFVNRGDQDDGSWTEWITRIQPDVLGFTDVRGRHGLAVAQANVGNLPFFMQVGEHALASRFPFRGSEVVRPVLPAAGGVQLGYLPAARFEVDAPGGPIAIYVVHIRSPRDALSKYRRPRFWKWTLLGPPPGVNPNNTLAFYWNEQAATLAALLERIRQDPLPTVVLGDFNLPDAGPRYRELTRTLQDAHRVAGRGFGYTFPGDIKHWTAFGAPWMRIDYILATQHWTVLECVVQDKAADSQHRGVFARLAR